MRYIRGMRYIYYNPNPRSAIVGDCAIRAVAKATGQTWDDAYIALMDYGFRMKNLPNADSVWGAYLKDSGFTRSVIPNTCPACYTVRDFCIDHPRGTYVLGTGSHVVTVIDGNYYDSWDSGDEIPIIYWRQNGVF